MVPPANSAEISPAEEALTVRQTDFSPVTVVKANHYLFADIGSLLRSAATCSRWFEVKSTPFSEFRTSGIP
jgi:hypothetical protein